MNINDIANNALEYNLSQGLVMEKAAHANYVSVSQMIEDECTKKIIGAIAEDEARHIAMVLRLIEMIKTNVQS
ncbi:MAG: hypothetical protein WC757_00485 [Candidatus Paceibacterota bacterium]|jgi:rubrerythrin